MSQSEHPKVTVWSVMHKDDDIEFNHVEDGWAESGEPTPVNTDQAKAWKGRNWIKEFAYLVPGDKPWISKGKTKAGVPWDYSITPPKVQRATA